MATDAEGGEGGHVIDLEPFLQKRRRSTCEHRTCLVDQSAAELTCRACGAEIDPWTYLRYLADHEAQWEAHTAALEKKAAAVREQIDIVTKQAQERIAAYNQQIQALVEEKNRLENTYVGDVRVGTSLRRRRGRA